MDTSRLASTAEDLISYKLEREGFLVSKPKFDIEGADLLIFETIKDSAKFCRVQCKGRALINSKSSNVTIFKNYVHGAFILFLFIDNGNPAETDLFCFSTNDIVTNWKLRSFKNPQKDYYSLSISKSTYKNKASNSNLLSFFYLNNKPKYIRNIIKQSDTKEEIEFLLDLINNQNKLIKLLREEHELSKLITEIKHKDEMIRLEKSKIKQLEKAYKMVKEMYEKHNSK